ncbi:MAG TPA: DUF1059 domain-containing protein [Acidimicrobiales bacterium]|nr:DUF1059 domain-containing protein [Acidimicrobiales bacterium]
MTFSFACGDVLPGCAARFQADSEPGLLDQVAAHAAADHGITDLDEATVTTVRSRIVTSP